MSYLPGEKASFEEREEGDDCERSPARVSRRNDLLPDDDGIDELISDAEASGLINDSIDRCFEATMTRRAVSFFAHGWTRASESYFHPRREYILHRLAKARFELRWKNRIRIAR